MTKKERKKICVGEELQIAVTLILQKFRLKEEQKEFEFPSSLTSAERAYIHRYCQHLGLKSKSRGKGANRYLTVYKKEGSTIVQADAVFELGRISRQHCLNLLQRYPVSARERQELLPPTERDRLMSQDARDVNRTTGRLNNGIPQIPPRRGDSDLFTFKQNLPIASYRDEIVQTIFCHQVVLITGDTGCGKTTQIPQFILDHCHTIGQPCRIICTQPRRLATLSVAERVAAERDEKVGQTVGYQIRLESSAIATQFQLDPDKASYIINYGLAHYFREKLIDAVTSCDNITISFDELLNKVAEGTQMDLVIKYWDKSKDKDEVHERDRFSDFLLLIIRDVLLKFRNLKLILMSATLDIQLFVKYFGSCPVIEVPGKIHDVQAYFLEDILKSTGYMSKGMQRYKKDLVKVKQQQQQLATWCSQFLEPSDNNSATASDLSSPDSRDVDDICDECNEILLPVENEVKEQIISDKMEIEPHLVKEMDDALQDAWLNGTEKSFSHLLHLILVENVSVDYQHQETSVTALMVSAGRGKLNTVEQLLALGASVHIRAPNEWTALDWAHHFEQTEVEDLLKASCSQVGQLEMIGMNSSSNIPLLEEAISEEDKELLDIYYHSFDDDKVDLDLILCLLQKIISSRDEGAVLVFLPGYDEIVSLRDKILSDEKNLPDSSRYIVYTLHSHIQSSDQKRVFKSTPVGVRKIILATNIAETSITINDVVFVIDSGKVKEKSYDALSSVTTLKSVWISQASVIQRRGRAGRCRNGICYHLYSRKRFHNFQPYQQPEILRVPIHELCLQAKLLAPPNSPIADFLARAPDPPAFMVTRNAVNLLKTIDALDPWEELTELGLHLLDLPIEPRLGKMVLYSVVLKCLDPVLTIVCALAYRNPFLIPSLPAQKRAACLARKKLAADTFSDHMALLRAFQAWQKGRSDGYEKTFCEKNFLSAPTMEIIVGMRTQLLGQLRASGFVRARGGGDIRDLNSNSENWAVVKAALCAGTYPNLIRVDRERQQLITQ
ncbi:probable ATP-dependent RNA helicase YTHDC2 [Centruroides sculpturatus]|uniref:probable ATP-dependent RNA helicase YTHDC2 n=1 Tax=Centruroides sculpturatus TaxID=218467 RepID=UPI000C6EF3A7|nr:probable ATP-dependent RNA helicase YTHDC2 [Centruroides sculpturatus]